MSGKAFAKDEYAVKVKRKEVPPHLKKQALQTSIYNLRMRHPFYASVLQCLNIEYSHALPTAGVMFDGNTKKFLMKINPVWFCERLTQDEREGVLLHEILHVAHKHLRAFHSCGSRRTCCTS